jgi:hypothetical protein
MFLYGIQTRTSRGVQLQLHLIYDRQSVGQSVLVSGAHLGPDQFFFHFVISLRQLRVCYFVAPSLTRGRVCNLLYNCFWALPEQSLFGRSPAELNDHILLSHLRLPQPGGLGSRIYIPQEQGGPVIPPGTGLATVGIIYRKHSVAFICHPLLFGQ